MYLHEAMEKLFRQVGRSMTTKEIAEKLNENKSNSKTLPLRFIKRSRCLQQQQQQQQQQQNNIK